MSHANISCALSAAVLLVYAHASTAAIHDFGNIQALSAPPISQLSRADADDSRAFSLRAHNGFMPHEHMPRNGSGLADRGLLNQYHRMQDIGAEVSPTAPAAAAYAPEPESYAMIVAGLGLIVFTARHRK